MVFYKLKDDRMFQTSLKTKKITIGDNSHFSQFIEHWMNPSGMRRLMALLLIAATLIGCVLFVYAMGGTKYVYVHIIYVPILLAAIFFKVYGGISIALMSGFLLGPFMPLDVAAGEYQDIVNWIFRTGFFVIVGSLSGLTFKILDNQLKRSNWLAFHDVLTQLPNRIQLEKIITKLINGNLSKFSLILLNIDNYLEIIHTLGHNIGDELLMNIGRRLQEKLPSSANISIFQTNRFGIIMPYESPQQNEYYTNFLIETLKKSFEIDDLLIFTDVSAGVANYPVHASSPASLIQKANYAMYTAQMKGLNYYSYNITTDKSSKDTLALLGQVQHAIDANQFELHFQPKMNIKNGEISGFEALIRWRHPQKGLVLPYSFIPQVERTGLINPITTWVIETALKQISQWCDEKQNFKLAINLSVRNLQQPDFLSVIEKLIDKYNTRPELLELEITESAIMSDPEQFITLLKRLRSLGLDIAIDDFGTGYSSLAYLKRLPINNLKIDQIFIKNLVSDKNDQEIVHAALTLAKSLGLIVIAEGVENKGSLELLEEYECDIAQGYYISRPLPVSEIAPWLKTYQ